MRRVVAAVVIVSTVSGCTAHNRGTRYAAGGGIVAIGGAVMLAPIVFKSDDGVANGIALDIGLALGGIIAGIGVLTIAMTASHVGEWPDEPNLSPTPNDQEIENYQRAHDAAVTGNCATAAAIAEQIRVAHEAFYLEGVMRDASIRACLAPPVTP